MSTKTSIKRIALVAAAALTLGGFSVITAGSANAATFSAKWTGLGYSNSSSTVNQVAGVPATVTLTMVNANVEPDGTYTAGTAKTDATISSTGIGTITAVTAGTRAGVLDSGPYDNAYTGPVGTASNTTITFPTTTLEFFGVVASGHLDTNTVTLSVFSSVVGTQTVTATLINKDGVAVGTAAATINWTASSGVVGISAAASAIGIVAGTTCTAQTSLGLANTYFANSGKTAGYYGTGTTGASGYTICVYTFDSNGTSIPAASISAFGPGGLITGSNPGAVSYANLAGDGLTKGTVTYTVYVKDSYGNTVSFTTPFTWYGKVASIALTSDIVADHASSTSATAQTYLDAADATGVHSIAITLKDSSGNTIPFSNWANVTNDVSATNTWILSDKGNGNTSTKKGQSNAYASLALGTFGDGGPSSKNNGGFTVSCSLAAKYEHLKITAYAYDSATGLDDFASNTVDFYCADTAKAVAVTAASASSDAGAPVAVNVNVTDANGYPVADGTKVAFAASNGGVFLGGDLYTTGGTMTNPTNLIVGASGDNAVTALVQGATPISGSTTVAVSGGLSGQNSLSLDAANAATDAANNAYDEAQNATQAASDALAAVTALSAQVGALIATVKSLAAVVAKIKAKVKA